MLKKVIIITFFVAALLLIPVLLSNFSQIMAFAVTFTFFGAIGLGLFFIIKFVEKSNP